ncbi:MAG: sulfatase-like hydrolase/transferase [Verrucomicrobia subdivision 3 bacterium]|nr:sulfatase-like hydrolase/transferase [Limisphaerales bacterium]
MKSLTKLFYAILVFGPLLSAPSSQAGERMNLLVLMADDLNTWILEKPERYSGKVIAPNLQAFGDSGVVFRNAYSASPFCVPSRTSLWSGVRRVREFCEPVSFVVGE